MKKHQAKILIRLCAGYVLIIAYMWIDEAFHLPQVLLGDDRDIAWHEALIETVAIIVIALPFLVSVCRSLERLSYLETLVHICAWCQNVNHKGRWISMDEYLRQTMQFKATHGICPACSETFNEGADGA